MILLPRSRNLRKTHLIQSRSSYKKASPRAGLEHLFRNIEPVEPPKIHKPKMKITHPPPSVVIPESHGVVSLPVPKTEISVAENGLTICSEELYEQMSYVALYTQAGSRYEVGKPGVASMLERFAWKGTNNRSASDLILAIEKIGAHVTSFQERDFLIYNVEVLRDFVPEALNILAESTTQPQFDENDFEEIVEIAKIEFQELREKPLEYMTEVLHSVAFQKDRLGSDHFAFFHNAESITAEDLYEHVNNCFVGSRMVLAGASVEHNEFVHHASQAFASVPRGEPALPMATYTGGELRMPLYDPEREGYYAIGFRSKGWASGEAEKIALLHKILGGGKSFSAGGPGKGMFARLYADVISSSADISSAECMAALRGDVGLFSVQGSAKERSLVQLQETIAHSLINLLLHPIPEDELQRAKVQLKASIFYNLESRSILCEDMARQVSIYRNHRDQAQSSCERIDSLTSYDLQKTLWEMLSTPPSVLVMAPPQVLSMFPDYQIIQHLFASVALSTQHLYKE